ncbi:hypothetical protein SNE40_017489 [Patella caerulea]|uniref:Transposable element P transposase-like GTP-binding insertion domain-containing protein n=1 Tax=Patella caerulea TaxID=87958 RepID=A0AAN8PM08_PATCE
MLWKHIIGVYDKDMQNELRRATKLTYHHVHLNSYSVMKVNLAAQVMSMSVSKIMQEYGGDEASETAKFVSMIDRFFACMNVRSLSESLRKRKPDLMPYTSLEDPRFKFLLGDFLGYLNEWKNEVESKEGFKKTQKSKMFLSTQTFKGLVMRTHAVAEATQFLLGSGVSFVLTNKFCQDPVEEHFGHRRALGRRNENPTVYQFGYQENKLRQQRS